MENIFKIYFNKRFVAVTENPETVGIEQKYWYKFETPKQIADLLLTFVTQEEIPSILIQHSDPAEIIEALKLKYKYLKAAGGLVKNSDGNYLFIYRLKKWDLPKGKKEEDENIRDTAVREVCEETGLKKVSLGKEIPSTYHTYQKEGKLILKRTYWFEMSSDEKILIPQTEENIEEARWVSPQEINEIMKNTYPAIRDVVQSSIK